MDTYIETAVNLANIIVLRETEWGDRFTLSTGLNINGDNAVIALFDTSIQHYTDRIPYTINTSKTQPCVFEHYKLQVSGRRRRGDRDPILEPILENDPMTTLPLPVDDSGIENDFLFGAPPR